MDCWSQHFNFLWRYGQNSSFPRETLVTDCLWSLEDFNNGFPIKMCELPSFLAMTVLLGKAYLSTKGSQQEQVCRARRRVLRTPCLCCRTTRWGAFLWASSRLHWTHLIGNGEHLAWSWKMPCLVLSSWLEFTFSKCSVIHKPNQGRGSHGDNLF